VYDENNTEYIGTINGEGHTITGLHINNNSGDQGFIGALGEGGTVKNLTFADVHMTAGQSSGIVAGRSRGTIENCHVTSGVNSYIHGSQHVGGIVGYNEGSVTGCTNSGTVTNCYSTGTITATGTDAEHGGVVGYTNGGGTVTNCYYLDTAASGGINGADVEGQVEAKTAAELASADMAVLLNGDQTDAPWEYIEGNASPTLKFFNKNKNKN